MDTYPGLRSAFSTVLQMKGGKRGGLYLHGPPSTGKSIIVRLASSLFPRDKIGICSRSAEDDKFWMSDLIGADLYVAEEMLLNDVSADALKMSLEGHHLWTVEQKYSKKRIPIPDRKPWIITSNFHLCCMCTRQTASVMARLFKFTLDKPIPDSSELAHIHTLPMHVLVRVAQRLVYGNQ